MGLFVGLGLPIGTHTLILGLVRIFWRYNVIVAFAFTFVNNPITLIPMYYGFYVLGSEITGSHAAMSVVEFKALMAPIIEAGHFVETVRRFVALGADILLKWTVGALLFSTPVAVVSYVVGFRYLKGRCERRAASMGITYDELIARMEADLRSGNGGKPSASAAEEKNPR
jgi:uncharacterized protein (DUF2062 family)